MEAFLKEDSKRGKGGMLGCPPALFWALTHHFGIYYAGTAGGFQRCRGSRGDEGAAPSG